MRRWSVDERLSLSSVRPAQVGTYLGLLPSDSIPPSTLLSRHARLLLLLGLFDPLELGAEVGVVERVVLGRVHRQLGDRPGVRCLPLTSSGRFGLLLGLVSGRL